MKKTAAVLVLSLFLTLPAQAGERFNVWQTAVAIGNLVVQNLEKLRLYSHQHANIQQQWDVACDVTESINPALKELKRILIENNINQKLGCAPITPILNYQINIIAQCRDFYSKPAPENAQLLLGRFAWTMIQARGILAKCYPEIAKVKFSLPASP